MARTKKTTPPAPKKRRGSAAVQPSLPNVPDNRDAEMERLDVQLVEAKAASRAAADERKAVEQRLCNRLAKLGLPVYRTASGFLVKAEPRVKLTRKPVPKASRKPQVV